MKDTPPESSAPHRADRAWVHLALEMLAQEASRSADTHLLKLNFPGFPDIDFYLGFGEQWNEKPG